MIRRQAACAPLAFALIPIAALMLSVACGDDGGSSSSSNNGGASGSSMDGGTKTNGGAGGAGGSGSTMIPRRDAGTATTGPDPITPCERNDPNGCASGEVCDLLIRRKPTDTTFKFYSGCVKATPERAEGDVCDSDITAGDQYETDGLTDIVYRDPCGEGLVCAPNRKVRGAFSCQKACATGSLGDTPFECADPTALCVGTGTGYSQFCRGADGCNIEKQTGCLGGETCYLIPSDDNKSLLTFCSGTPDKPTADGMPCQSLVECKPGSVCFGPVRTPMSAWKDAEVLCRPVCDGPGTSPTQSSDEDAGLPNGLCSSTTKCQAYSESGLMLSSIPTPPFGQCESQ